MSAEKKILIALCLIACALAGAAVAVIKTESNIDYAISKSCAESQAFKIKNTHYMCIEIEERKK